MANYAIEVHALKSDAKYLGFTKLAEIAYDQELRSKENNQQYIISNYAQLKEEVSRVEVKFKIAEIIDSILKN